MKDWLITHFNVQQGMYFDTLYVEGDMLYFGSNSIEDSVWNYGMVDEITDMSILRFVKFCKKIGKPSNLYMSRDNADKFNDKLVGMGFTGPFDADKLITETWMEFGRKNYSLDKDFDIQNVVTQKQKQDFMDVFLAAYGGEKTPEKPYGSLPAAYKKCVEESFGRSKFYNFICYYDGNPVSVATLCMDGKKGGLYNIGTKPQYERRGFGLAVTDACINQWEKLSGELLFLQTETGTGIDSWYEKIGFKRIFEGVVYEKK